MWVGCSEIKRGFVVIFRFGRVRGENVIKSWMRELCGEGGLMGVVSIS